MKKNYQKPTFESITLKKEHLLAGSCTTYSVPVCSSDTCSGADVI
jgi:hypothetical protein